MATAELMLRTLNEAQLALVIESLSSRNYTARSAAVSLLGKSSSCVALGALTQRLTVENDYTLTQNLRTAIASVRERTSCTASE